MTMSRAGDVIDAVNLDNLGPAIARNVTPSMTYLTAESDEGAPNHHHLHDLLPANHGNATAGRRLRWLPVGADGLTNWQLDRRIGRKLGAGSPIFGREGLSGG